MDFMKPETVLELSNIREALVRLEDTIIFNFIERSQFYSSPSVYKTDKFKIPNFHGSFVDFALLQREKVESQLRRYEAPDELPFFPDDLLQPLLPPINYPKVLASYCKQVNVNGKIKEYYVNTIVPEISVGEGEQPENLGSCTSSDVECLQSLSRRIHFGQFVAESKFINDKETFTKLILAKDVKGIEKLITNRVVEEKILKRLYEKAVAYGTDPLLKTTQNKQSKVKPEVLVKIYKDWIIPLTKEVEIDYLLRRLEDE